MCNKAENHRIFRRVELQHAKYQRCLFSDFKEISKGEILKIFRGRQKNADIQAGL